MDTHDEGPDTSIRDGAVVLGIVILLYVSTNITPITFDSVASGEAPAALLAFFLQKIPLVTIQSFLFSLQNTLTVFALIFLVGIFWLRLRAADIHHHEHEKYAPVLDEEIIANEKFIQWQVILDHVNSESPAEWKLAILEADNILDEVLEDMGYVGETVAEKLKGMSRAKVSSYDAVWEAHKLRNEIAHGGAIDMEITKKIAKDAIAKFENAFKDLGYL
ncbi:MAG: hypothetical protein HZB10_02520 [Candidatus Yonathbacteria bacterium]|nr:hypothetical protein [Candidatus Yonathbacteria bacterium]